jgi:Prenyltransferase and squalene oxidase repeat
VTKQEPEFLECEQDSDLRSWLGRKRPGNAEAVVAGLDYLASRHQNGRWSILHAPELDDLNTARILVFLKDVPALLLGHRLRQKIRESLDWLMESQVTAGGWQGRSGDAEALATAWAILALKKNSRTVPQPAIDWLWRCRGRDGGFVTRPESAEASSLEATAVAVQALGMVDADGERFLCARLQGNAPGTEEQLAACAALLDCDKSLLPFPLLNHACQITASVHPASARDKALLLRCLLRLRLTRAWVLADNLRAARLADGSWAGTDQDHALATATALSALALVDAQPGLYFGSDLPRPRRLQQSS